MTFSLDQLRGLDAVARTANVTRAAAELFVSQPTLSRQLAALETEVGAPLLDRGPSGVTDQSVDSSRVRTGTTSAVRSSASPTARATPFRVASATAGPRRRTLFCPGSHHGLRVGRSCPGAEPISRSGAGPRPGARRATAAGR